MLSVGSNSELTRNEVRSTVPYSRFVSNWFPGANSVRPSRSSVAPASRKAQESVTGTLTMPRNPNSESSPAVIWPEASNASVLGFAV